MKAKTSKTNADERLVYSPREAGTVLGLSYSTLEKMRAEGRGPAYVKIEGGRRVGYPKAELMRYLAERAEVTRRQMARQRKAQEKLGLRADEA